MSNKNPSPNKDSDMIRKRASELIERDKYKFEIKALRLSKIAIFIALLALLFSIFVYYRSNNQSHNSLAPKANSSPNTIPANK